MLVRPCSVILLRLILGSSTTTNAQLILIEDGVMSFAVEHGGFLLTANQKRSATLSVTTDRVNRDLHGPLPLGGVS